MRRHMAFGALIVALCLLSFGAAAAMAAAPKISGTTFSLVNTSSAQIEAEVDPQGKATKYHFEYGTADCSLAACTSLPDGPQISGASPPQAVSAQLSGLAPATAYHFRLVAKNSEGELKGPDISFSTYALSPTFAVCSNDEPFRTGPSALLPDCRAYEQASPMNKNGADVNGGPNQVQASTAGDAVAFFSAAGLPGSVGGQDFTTYLARRGPGSWSTQGVYPPASTGVIAKHAGWAPDLSQFFSLASPTFGSGPWTLRSRASADGSLTTIASPVAPDNALAGTLTSADGSKVLFQNSAQLAPGAVAGKENLYLWDRDTGSVSLAGILPDSECGSPPPCAPPGGAFAGSYNWFEGSTAGQLNSSAATNAYYLQSQHAFSADGSNAYFTAGGAGQLYLRRGLDGPSPETVRVSTSQRTTPDPLGARPAAFLGATADGSQAFFTSPEELTDDANTGPEVTGVPTIARASIGSGIDSDFLPAHAAGLALDSEHFYWADPVDGTIGRATLEGDQVEPEFITGADNPQGVAVDAEHIYWTNAGEEKFGSGTVGRADLDGDPESVEQDFIDASYAEASANIKAFNPRGIAVNSTHVYWGDVGSGPNDGRGHSLMRALLNGNGAEAYGEFDNDGEGPGEEIFPQNFAPFGLAVNDEYAYFTEADQHGTHLMRQSLSNPLAVKRLFMANRALKGLTIEGPHFYWADSTSGSIGRANLNLEDVEPEWITGAEGPLGLAVDASHVYWSANQEVHANPGTDLYRYAAGTGQLTDLTPDSGDVNGAEVLGLLGASEDGSHLYFVANGDLDGAGPASQGDCRGIGNLNALTFKGHCSLYLYHAGSIEFIAGLDSSGDARSDAANWEPRGTAINSPEATARVSADGDTLVFRSQEKLTAYENEGVPEFYRYRAGESGLLCLSCNPTGEPPAGRPRLQSIEAFINALYPPNTPPILTRNLSADGERFFFETPDRLVDGDVNGEDGCPLGGQANVPTCQDVYEWEAEGTGSCHSSAQNGGCLYLLSSGTGEEAAFFADAALSGEDAFIFSRDALVPQDEDQLLDVYDARVAGGLETQYPRTVVPCEAEGCKGPVGAAPESSSPGSATFKGPADPKPHKSRKRAHRKKRHHHKRHAHERAGAERGGHR